MQQYESSDYLGVGMQRAAKGVTGSGEERKRKSGREWAVVEGKDAVETQVIEAKIWTAVLLLVLTCFMSGRALLFQSSVSQPQHQGVRAAPSHHLGSHFN